MTKAGGHIYTQMKVTQIVRGKDGRVTGVIAVDKNGKNQAFNGKT